MEGLKPGDESCKLSFNASGHEEDILGKLRPGEYPGKRKNKLVKEIDDLVDFANNDEDWKRKPTFIRRKRAVPLP